MIYFKAAFRKLRCLGVADPSTDHQPLIEAYRCSVVRQTLLCTRRSLSPLQRRGSSLRGWRQWCGPGRFWACTATPSRENTPRRSGLLSATTEIPRAGRRRKAVPREEFQGGWTAPAPEFTAPQPEVVAGPWRHAGPLCAQGAPSDWSLACTLLWLWR